MKPAPFEYCRPTSLKEAARLLAEHGADAKILAGGQTLVAMMNYRLAAPNLLIDINAVPALNEIELTGDGLSLGALVRWRDIERDWVIAEACPLLAEAVTHIAHYQIRNRGTWAGSAAHADPAAEFPAVAVACGAEFELVSSRGSRSVHAEDFFLGPLTTALEPDEIIVRVRFPTWPAARKWTFQEFSLRPGDFALAGIVAVVDVVPAGLGCRLTCFGVGDKPTRLLRAEQAVAASALTRGSIEEIASIAMEEIDPPSDIHADGDYRRSLVGVLVERGLSEVAAQGGWL